MAKSYKYTIDIQWQTTKFEQNMVRATGQARTFAKETKAAAESNGFLSGSLGKLTAVIGGTAGALKILHEIINSTKGSSDEFKQTMGGLETATEKFFSQIASGNFSNLIENLKKAKEAGEKYTEALDKIEERTLGLSLEKSKKQPELVAQEEIFRDRSADPVKRMQALNEYKRISVELAKKESDIANARVTDEEDILAGLGLQAGRLKELYENYSDNFDLIDSIQKKLARLYEIQKEIKAESGRAIPNLKKANDLQSEAEKIIKGLSSQERIYMGDLMTNDLAKQERINSYIQSLIKQNEATAAIGAVNRDNLRIENMITDELKQQNKEEEKAAEIAANRAAKPATMSTGNLTLPTFFKGQNMFESPAPNSLAKSTAKMPIQTEAEAAEYAMRDLADRIAGIRELKDPFEFLTKSVDELGKALEGGGETWEDYANKVASAAEDIIAALLGETVANAIANAIKAAGFTGPAAVVMMPILTAAATGLVKTAFHTLIPKFAEGGLAYGPSIGMFGEYPGARHNPEVIAPLSKLQGMINTPLSSGKVKFYIEGRYLTGILENENRLTRNIRGK